MAQPVWVLSVDLQTKTATFQSGMADAARSARGAFTEIKEGAGEMGRESGYSMMEARHSVMMLGEEFGIKLPRAVAGFVASIGPLGPIMEAAFPFLAIAAGATILIEHFTKLHEEAEKLASNQAHFGLTVHNTFNELNEKLITAEIRADELRKDHLGALKLTLEQIDHQSLNELSHSFEEVAKIAEETLGGLKSSWYQLGSGSAGAQHALTEFRNEYELLLATPGKSEEAAGLLSGTLKQAQHVLDMMHEVKTTEFTSGKGADNSHADYAKNVTARNELKAYGVGITEKEVQAQQTLVDALTAQVTSQQIIARLQAQQGQNAKTETNKAMEEQAGKHGDAIIHYTETVNRMIAEEDKQSTEGRIRIIVEGEKQRVAATKEGSEARLAAIGAAMHEEESFGMQGMDSYHALAEQKINLVRQMAEEQATQEAEAGKEAAEQQQKMGELMLAAEKEHQKLMDSAHRMTIQQRVAEEVKAADEEYQLKLAALQREAAALDKSAKDYQNKLVAIQDREKQLIQQHQNQITQIEETAQTERNQRMLSAEQRMDDQLANGLTKVLMGHESFAKMMDQLGNQVVSGMMETAIKSVLANDYTKESDAAAAARKAFLAGMQMPFPVNIVMGPVLGAAAFAAVMAFADGGIVPGVGNGDTVPAMLTPGETVLPKKMTENLANAASGGNGEKHYHTTHVHIHAQALDGDGMDKVLEKNAHKIQQHIDRAMRKRNR